MSSLLSESKPSTEITLLQKAEDFLKICGPKFVIRSSEGILNMTESFSSSLVQNPYEGPVFHNLADTVPFLMCADVSVNVHSSSTSIQLTETFESSLRIFRRPAWYGLGITRVIRNKSYINYIRDNFGFWGGRCMHSGWTRISNLHPERVARASTLTLIYADNVKNGFKIPAIGVVDKANYPFMMACRRHGLTLPKSMVYVMYNETMDKPKNTIYPIPRLWKELKEHLSDNGIYTKAVAQSEIDAMLVTPKMHFKSITELKKTQESAWEVVKNQMKRQDERDNLFA